MSTTRSTEDEPTGGSSIHLHHILVPIDFSDSADKALRYGVSFATQYRARLTLLHVVEPPMYPTELGYVPIELETLNKTLLESAESKLKTMVGSSSVGKMQAVDVVVRLGHPYREVTEVAREFKVDLIVISTHGYTGLKHVVLGSTAERIVRHAPCPVLTVRETEHDFVD